MSRTARILVADDEPNFNQVVRAELERRGHQAFAVYDGLEALACVREREFELVLLDVRMPGMEGLEVLRTIREIRPQLPVIMMTAYESTQSRSLAQELGAQAYLVKPFEAEELLRAVEVALEAQPSAQLQELLDAAPVLTTLEAGQQLSLTVYSRQHAGTFPVELRNPPGNTVALAMPRFGGPPMVFPLRTPVFIGFGLEDGWYEFSGTVVGISPSREQPVLLITRPERISRVQRRRELRTPVHLTVSCRLPDDPAGFAGEVLDLTPEGLRLRTDTSLALRSELWMQGPIGPEGQHQERPARVVWSTVHEGTPLVCESGLHFVAEHAPPGEG